MLGGRPKKYLTAKAKAAAKRRHNHENADIPVPQDPHIPPHESLEGEDVYRPPSPLAQPAGDDLEIAALVNQLDARTAEILIEMQTGVAHTRISADKAPEHIRDADRSAEPDSVPADSAAGQSQAMENSNLQRSSVAPIENTRSLSYLSICTLAKATNAPAKALHSPQTPSRSTSFPAQRVTLLSWVKSAASQPSSSSSTPRTPPPPSSNSSTPRLPQPSNGNSYTHEEYAERPDVHSTCSSLEEITRLISGVYNGGTPLPDVLSNPKLMKPSDLPKGLDLKAANKGRATKVRFDIDSVCCFPSSLAFAWNGINWHPRAYPILNLDADIHFSLTASAYNYRGDLVTKNLPLHKVPHYCFSSVAGSIKSLLIFIFFLELHLESRYEHTTYLSKQDQQLWLDAVLLPAISKTVNDLTLVSFLLASKDNASLGVTTLWTTILERITENLGLSRFNGATLFAHAKNTKLAHMTDDLTFAYKRWEKTWAEIAHPQFYSKDRTYVDIAKIVTSEDYANPYDSRYYLESYACTRVTTYPWATMRDMIGQTLSTVPRGQENIDRLVYSQFYVTIKTPFNVLKVYVFDNEVMENLALDPSYIHSLYVCKGSYLHSKKRAFSNLRDNQRRSYGIREEHRVSLTMMDEIYEQ
ncbi:hypothetical protein CC80DRAFT_515784 [Byssothecium circinans]|uniref:Uncharacterized protein n=1 Tax=Byssothecium circinans TaxID=147558 RepID=A0A6A5U995_9PLEO|nr:hypothetical protein CC80DRAFT_515784 [Byssothecium circinans]